jgi:hypothetical protein
LYLIRHGEASPHDGPLSEVGQIAYETSMPPRLISFNDAGHLPPALRWTGFPPAARPPSG